MNLQRAALLFAFFFTWGCSRTSVVVAQFQSDGDVEDAELDADLPSDAEADARDAEEELDAPDAPDADTLPPTAIVSMAAGHEHSCAVRADGTIWCWGSNDSGQLGIGNRERWLSPTFVPDIDDVAGTSAYEATTCAWSHDGEAWCWGDNMNWQVGDGSTDLRRLSPSQVHGLSGIDGMSVGSAHSCAWGGGEGWCWGSDAGGNLGNGEELGASPIPTPVLLDGIDEISRRCAVTTASRAFCWGSNLWGQLGVGDSVTFGQSPIEVTSMEGVIGLSADDSSACAWLDDGTTMCWGRNNGGQLGPGVPIDPPLQYLPVANLLSNGIMGIGSGTLSRCAWFSGASPMCFGYVRVEPNLSGLSDVQGIAEGQYHGCAWEAGGRGYCWGSNEEGQLGDGSTSPSADPREILFPE